MLKLPEANSCLHWSLCNPRFRVLTEKSPSTRPPPQPGEGPCQETAPAGKNCRAAFCERCQLRVRREVAPDVPFLQMCGPSRCASAPDVLLLLIRPCRTKAAPGVSCSGVGVGAPAPDALPSSEVHRSFSCPPKVASASCQGNVGVARTGADRTIDS